MPSLQAGTLSSHLTGVTRAGQSLLTCPLPPPKLNQPTTQRSPDPTQRETPTQLQKIPHPVLSKTLVPGPGHPEPAALHGPTAKLLLLPTTAGTRGPRGGGPSPSTVPLHRPRCHLRSRGAANLKPSTQHNSPSLPHPGSKKPLPSTLVQEGRGFLPQNWGAGSIPKPPGDTVSRQGRGHIFQHPPTPQGAPCSP